MENFYSIYMYTPMPEMHNEMVPLTRGCSYKKCLYCDLNYKEEFKIFKLSEIENFLIKRKIELTKMKKFPKKFTLLEGNPLCVRTDYLLSVMKLIHKYFDVEYISMFARVKDVLKKSDNELFELKKMGLDRICLGLESGSDEVLTFQKKRKYYRGVYFSLQKIR